MSNDYQSMSCADLKVLPLGFVSFGALRRQGRLYVDKTQAIYELCNSPSPYVFLSRPRRFGKTVLVSTFESLFKYGVRDFRGLAIEKIWHDRTYPVIRFDFSYIRTVRDLQDFKSQFSDLIVNAVKEGGLQLPPVEPVGNSNVLECFDSMLGALPPEQPVVLLIDEYDAPLNCCLGKDALFEEVQGELSKFYDRLKARSGKFRFWFVTGICRYRNTGIFTGSNIEDISMDVKYGTLLGYTEQEMHRYFSPFVENAAKVNGMTFAECFEKMKAWYDGFCFDQKAASHVFSPWSVLNFLAKPENGFQNYWYESSGTPSVLLNFIRDHSVKDPAEYGKDVFLGVEDLRACSDLRQISDISMLAQTGYLSVKEAWGSELTLNYPNAEVARSMAKLYRGIAFSRYDVDRKNGVPVGKLMALGDPADLMEKFNTALGAVPYDQFAVSGESAVRALIIEYLAGGDLFPYAELHNALGRSDLELQAGGRWYVIEFKYAREGDDEDALLAAAVSQIESRRYGEHNHPELEHIRVALVYSEKQRRFTRSKVF